MMRPKHRSRNRRRLAVEGLEARQMMSADVASLPLPLPSPEISFGESDQYQFEAEAGSHYVFETLLRTLPDTTLALYGPSGEQIAFDDDGGYGFASRVEFTAQESGSYRVEVAPYSSFQTGSYQLAVNVDGVAGLPDPVPSPEITLGGESDSYQFDAVAGIHYDIQTALGSLPDTTLTLYGPFDEPIAFDDDGGDGLASRIQFTAQQSGTYRVEVAPYSGYQTGTYQLSINVDGVAGLPQPPPSPDISYSGESDYFQFEAVAGVTYEIETVLGTLADTTLTLYGQNGEQIAFDDDGGYGFASRIVFTADQSGPFIARVAAYGRDQTGSYGLSVTDLDNAMAGWLGTYAPGQPEELPGQPEEIP